MDGHQSFQAAGSYMSIFFDSMLFYMNTATTHVSQTSVLIGKSLDSVCLGYAGALLQVDGSRA